MCISLFLSFLSNGTACTVASAVSLHDALPILQGTVSWNDVERGPQSMPIGPACLDVGIERALPIRRGHSYQHRRNYEGHYWCAGTGRHVWYESMTEYTALMHLDHTERLSAVATQPVCLYFADGSRHYPDFFALHESGEKVKIGRAHV